MSNWDYTEADWDYKRDGYSKVEHAGKTIFLSSRPPPWHCDLCGAEYIHYFVSAVDWAEMVAVENRDKKLCLECYAPTRGE